MSSTTGRKRKTSPSRLSESSSEDEVPPPKPAAKVQRTSWNSDVKTGRSEQQQQQDYRNRDGGSETRYHQGDYYQGKDKRGGGQQQQPHFQNDRDRYSNQRNNYYKDRDADQQGSRGPQNQQYDDRSRNHHRSSGGNSNFYNSPNNDSYRRGGGSSHQYHDRDSQYSGNNSRSSNQSFASHGQGLAPVVARHYNEIEERGLEAREESKIVILRKYNNWAKSMNFNDAMEKIREAGKANNSLIGLDLCCGKGGDLRKWEKSRMMRHVVFVDIAEVSLNNCKERYEEMKRKHEEQRERRGGRVAPLFTAEFFVADCTRESVKSKMRDPEMKFDIVSCQFSFHYCFESSAQAQQMLTNATENLVSGGYFIGTLPNAARIVKRRRECKQAEFGNEVYKIRFECDEPYPVYGARYFFELEDAISCPEFLVHFPTLEKLADKFDLKLVYCETFDEFHKKHADKREGKQLLNGMGALEPYPPNHGEALRFNEDSYDHVRKFLQEKGLDRNAKVGTISSVEWEAIRLYLAFCFKKI